MKPSAKHETELANLATELGLPKTRPETGHSWSCHCVACGKAESERSGRILKAFGLPTHKDNGHRMGCRCAPCRALSDQRSEEIRRDHEDRKPPTTIAGMLMSEIRKSREH